MKFIKLPIALLFISSLLIQTTTAQVTTSPAPSSAAAAAAPASKPDELTAEQLQLERKALALLDEIIGETPSLKLVENRIRLQATAAEILWPRDEERARELFNAAAGELAAVTIGIETDDQQQYYNLTNMVSQLRHRMLDIIARRDPKLALEFLRATRQPPPPVQPGSNYRQPDQELTLEAQLAQQIAARDPQQALRLAEEILQRGLSSNLVSLLEQLRTRDAEGAARLAASMTRKLRTAGNFAADYEATGIAGYLLIMTRPPENASGQQTGQQTVAANLPNQQRRLQLDEAARRELVNSLVSAALNNGGNAAQEGNLSGLLSTMRQLMPEVERYAPTQAAALLRRMDNFERRNDPNAPGAYRQVMETGTSEAIIEAAAKAPTEMRLQLYRTAAFKALGEGQPERARQIINSNVDDARMREQWLKELDQQLFWRAASEVNIEQAQAALARIKSTEERVGMLIQLAHLVAKKGNTQAAAGFVEEAWNLMGERAKNQLQFSVQLYLAQVAAPIAPVRSFEIMEASVTRLNELIAAAAVLEGFGQEGFAQDELKTLDGYMWSSFITKCGETLAALAPVDFEHARSIADKFQRPELRLPARLAVVRGILSREGEQNNLNRSPLRRGRR